jgi:sulfite exporter TauE/SafE
VSNETIVLAGTAAAIAFGHTLLGPDHYLPFIVLSKARQWSSTKTVVITLLCGIGHILSSVILGFIGVALGIALFKLEAVESFRGELAAWLLIAFGLTYFIWGLHRAIRSKSHVHLHLHKEGGDHLHPHGHMSDHTHVHTSKSGSLTPWVIFIIFLFGPCEPLIPILMYPAAKNNMISVALVASIFGLVTIVTMLSIVLASYYGLSKLPLARLERYSHAVAGMAVFLCGGAIKLLGL